MVFLGHALQGDLGQLALFQEPALSVLLERMPATLQLSGVALLFSLSVAIPVGLLSALRRDTFWSYFGTGLAMLGQAIPPYWLGIMLILVFSVGAGLVFLLPEAAPVGIWSCLPATLGSVLMALVTRLVRSGMLDVLSEDYIRTAHAKGLPKRAVIVRHALRNILIPLVTVVGLQLGALFGGAVITESIFAWPGVGRLALQAISKATTPWCRHPSSLSLSSTSSSTWQLISSMSTSTRVSALNNSPTPAAEGGVVLAQRRDSATFLIASSAAVTPSLG